MTDDAHSRTQMPGLARAEANGMAPPALDPRRWAALVVILAAGFMDLLDVTIVNVAAPSILRDLHATYAQFEWVISGYLLGFAALLITGGRLGDIFGRKRMFLLGVAGVTVSSWRFASLRSGLLFARSRGWRRRFVFLLPVRAPVTILQNFFCLPSTLAL